jgi:serine/threonine protein kinase
MENKPSIRSRDDDALDGSTVHRPVNPVLASVGSTASASPDFGRKSKSEGLIAGSSPLPSDEAKTVIRKVDSKSGSSVLAGQTNATPASVASVLLGTRLNHFLLEELIGGGGMGAVFRARDDRLDRVVAIKVIPFVGEDQDLQRRFRNEAQNAARLDHPYIARVFDVGQFEQWHYIVFEHVEGINLRDMVARDGVLSIDDAVYYTRQIAEAIEHANSRGIVHRDIKPSNVLVGIDGNVKVVDMGLARSQQIEVSEDMTASGVTLGTFDYISPEQARDPRDADVRSDIYSLGCTLYYLLTASPPYPGGTMLQKLLSHGNAPPPDPRGLRPEVSGNLTAIIHKMLAKDPAARYPRAIDVVADLRELAIREGLIRSQARGTYTIASSDPVPQFMQRHVPWAVAALIVLAIAAWLQISSTIRKDEFAITPPPPDTQASTIDQATSTPQDAGMANSVGERMMTPVADGTDPPSVVTLSPAAVLSTLTDDVATAPPRFGDVAKSTLPPSPAPRPDAVVPVTTAAIPIERIVVGDASLDPSVRVVPTLIEAIRVAQELGVNIVEITRPLISTPPIKIERDNLVIRSTVNGGTQVRFVTGETQTMERIVAIDAGSNRLDMQNLHLMWTVRSTNIAGGALIHLASDNRLVRLSNGTITVENLIERDEVYAFEIEGPDSPDKTKVQSRVGIELENFSARGEMTFINLVDAVPFQLQWQNGLLAVSRRLLEAAGAVQQPVLGSNQIQITMDQVTAWAQEGLARMRVGPSGSFPLLIDRNSRRSAFRCNPSANYIEFDGLSSFVDDLGQWVQFRGEDNAYDFDLFGDPSLLMLRQWNNQTKWYRLSSILAPENPNWISDRSLQLQWVVRWAKPIPEITPSRLTSADFLQDGRLTPGFDKKSLPLFPARSINDAEI